MPSGTAGVVPSWRMQVACPPALGHDGGPDCRAGRHDLASHAAGRTACLGLRGPGPLRPARRPGGGSSWPRTLSSPVRPSVSSACRVSPGRLSGPAGQALPLISITTRATSAPPVISQRQPRAPAPAHVPAQVRADLPAHRSETTTTHAAPGEPGGTTTARPPGSPARRHAGPA